MHRILTLVGTRPDAVKMSPLIKELKKREGIECTVLSSGQHKDILTDVLGLYGIASDIDLDVMRCGQSLGALTERLTVNIRPVLEESKWDALLVHGDTTTAFVGAMLAFSLGIPVGHVEAGLRSGRLDSPFPEEMNRRAIALLASLHFAPNESARRNLLTEGIASDRIFVTGNTVYDALAECYDASFTHPVLSRFQNERYAVLTAHRRENRGKLEQIFLGVRDALEACRVFAVFPVHPSSEVRFAAEKAFGSCKFVHLMPPLAPYDFVNLLARCSVVITDSGGVQEEAPAFSKPVLVLRDNTERVEELSSGALMLGGTSRETVSGALMCLLTDEETYRRAANAKSRTDTGAALMIADIICGWLKDCRAFL